MTRTPALPLSLTHAAVSAHLAELRAEADRERLAHAVPRRRRSPAWPTAVAAALRGSVSSALPSRRKLEGTGRRASCATC